MWHLVGFTLFTSSTMHGQTLIKLFTAISATQCQKSRRRVDLKSHDVYESMLQDYNDIWVFWRVTSLLLNVGLTVLRMTQLIKSSVEVAIEIHTAESLDWRYSYYLQAYYWAISFILLLKRHAVELLSSSCCWKFCKSEYRWNFVINDPCSEYNILLRSSHLRRFYSQKVDSRNRKLKL